MKIVPYEPWHYEYLASKTFTTLRIGTEAARLFAFAYEKRGNAITVRDGTKVVGCAGIIEYWEGVGEAWTMFTDELRKKPLFLHRNTLEIMDAIAASRNLHRTQATVLSTDPIAVRWIERLGFERESTLYQFGSDKSDHFMYVRRM